jgi:hypothetical protein
MMAHLSAVEAAAEVESMAPKFEVVVVVHYVVVAFSVAAAINVVVVAVGQADVD